MPPRGGRPADELGRHKLTLGVRDDAVAKFEDHIRGGLDKSGVRAKVITSGHGGWKYVDIVSAQAGKLESLEHVRRELGFALEATVACGDSGNDILMLSGQNRALVVGNAQPDLLKWVQSGDNQASRILREAGAAHPDSRAALLIRVAHSGGDTADAATTRPFTPTALVSPPPCDAQAAAKSRERLLLAKKGHAAGILEGLAHWGFA